MQAYEKQLQLFLSIFLRDFPPPIQGPPLWETGNICISNNRKRVKIYTHGRATGRKSSSDSGMLTVNLGP